jgi:hypothetical protein
VHGDKHQKGRSVRREGKTGDSGRTPDHCLPRPRFLNFLILSIDDLTQGLAQDVLFDPPAQTAVSQFCHRS